MTITATYIGQSTIQITNSFQNGLTSSSGTTFMTFANAVADAMIGTQPSTAGALSGVTFAAQGGVTAQNTASYSPTPSTNSGWTYYDAFWGGQDGVAGASSPVYTQVFRSVNKDNITAKNLVLRYNTKEQVVNATTYQYWDSQTNYDAGSLGAIGNTAVTASTVTTAGNANVTVASTTNIYVGQVVTGSPYIPSNAYVTAINGSVLTLSQPISAPITSVSLSYSNLSANAATTVSSTAPAGNLQVSVTSATNIATGQLFTAPSIAANVAPLTTVTAVSGTLITLSTPLLGAIASSTPVVFTNTSHAGTNEAYTYFDSAPIPYNLTLCDFIVNVSPRWCLFHSYLNGEPGMWAGIVETAREDIMDTAVSKNPCWGWISSTLWHLGSTSITTKPLGGGGNGDYTLLCMPKTKVGNSGVNAARGWGGDYGITSFPTWAFPATPLASFISLLGSAANKFQANGWDNTRRLTLPIKPISDFSSATVTNYGQIYGMKVLAPVGQNMNKINIAVDSDGNASATASDRNHWILNCHYKLASATSILTDVNTSISNYTWAVNAKPLGIVSVGSTLYYYCSDRIGKIDMLASSTTVSVNYEIILGQSGYSDMKYDGERYIYVSSTTAAIAITKIDIMADNVGTTFTQAWSSGGAVGTNTVVVGSATNILVGQGIIATGVAPGVYVTGVNGTTITMSSNAIANMVAGSITFVNTNIISTVSITGGVSALAINGDTICVAGYNAGTALAQPIFNRYVRQGPTGTPAAFVASAVPQCTSATVTDTVIIRDITADFEGNFWAAGIFATATNFKPIKIDRNPSSTLVLPTWTTTAGNIYPATLITGSINFNMLDGNNLYIFGTQSGASTTSQYVHVNPRTLTVIANGVGGTMATATTAGSSGSYAKIQGNLYWLPKNSAAAGNAQIAPLGRNINNTILAPITNSDVTTTFGSATTFNTCMHWDGVKMFMSYENNIRFFVNFNGGITTGGNPAVSVTFGQLAVPA